MTTRALFIYLYVVWINQSDVILHMTTPSQSKSLVWLTQIPLLNLRHSSEKPVFMTHMDLLGWF